MTRRSSPIDPRQHVLWHRLRRFGPFGFSFLGTGIAVFATLAMFTILMFSYGEPWGQLSPVLLRIILVTTPIYFGSCLWTWSHMEKRYGVTLAIRCPECGYQKHDSAKDACPECGAGF